jgi:hypothetical protein
MKLLIVQASSASCLFVPLKSKIFLSILYSNTLNLGSSRSVRDQVSHPYKTPSTNMVICRRPATSLRLSKWHYQIRFTISYWRRGVWQHTNYDLAVDVSQPRSASDLVWEDNFCIAPHRYITVSSCITDIISQSVADSNKVAACWGAYEWRKCVLAATCDTWMCYNGPRASVWTFLWNVSLFSLGW